MCLCVRNHISPLITDINTPVMNNMTGLLAGRLAWKECVRVNQQAVGGEADGMRSV